MSGPQARVALLFATSGHSGVDRVIGNLLPQIARSGRAFDLLTIRGHGPYIDDHPANIRPVGLAAAHRNTVVPALVRYLRRERPAALLTASHRLNRAALLARRLARVDCRIAIRMGMSLAAQAEELGPRRGKRLLRSMRAWYPRAEAVIAPSEGVGDDLQRLAGVTADRLHVIANPIVTPQLQELASAPLVHGWFGPDAPPVILGVGSLEPRKDFATLLRAFARIRATRPCRLVVLGEGRQREPLSELARELGVAEDMALPGFEPNPYRYMARASVFALCSRREGSGAVLVEALACGLPAVSTDCPSGPAEILQRGKVGPLVPVGDDAALAGAIERQLDQRPALAEFTEATAPFDARRAAQRYLDAVLGPHEEALP